MGSGKQSLAAVCDANLLGKTLEFGKIKFDIRREFYGESLVTIKEALYLIKNTSNINLVGSQIISEVIKEGLIHPQSIILISGVPHAQIIRT